jgi:hypothetical protein
MKASYASKVIRESYDVLEREEDLSPNNPKINETLARLVQTLSLEYTPQEETFLLNDPKIIERREKILEKLACAEGEMEFYWARKFCQQRDLSSQDLEKFWYWQNYLDLATGESQHLPKQAFMPDESLCFVGSGPLPLTAIVLNKITGRRITCVDIDPQACEISEFLLRKTGYANSIRVVQSSGEDYNYNKHPAVLLASLVPDKNAVLRRISESGQHCCVGLRSAEKLHTLLYDPVDEGSEELSHCQFTARTSHDPKIINTTLFYHSEPGWHMNVTKHVKGLRPDKFGWRNPDRPLFPPPANS